MVQGAAADRARRLALSLPGAVEQDHHGIPSFRVAKTPDPAGPER